MPHEALYLDKLDEVWEKRQERYNMSEQPFVLRDYQNQACDEITGSVALGSQKVILDAPTGAGKSAILAGLAKDLPGKVAIVVTFTPLIEQIAKHLEMMGVDYSIVKAGMDDRYDEDKRVQLIMKQTYHARMYTIGFKADYMLKDEVHVEWFGQKRMDEIYVGLGKPTLIGVSGTPFDSKGYMLRGADDLIRSKSIAQLTEEGHLSPLKYFIPKWAEEVDYSKIAIKGKDYSESEIDGIVLGDEYMEASISSMLQMDIANKKSVVFCNSIEHADLVAASLRANGVRAYPFHSKMDKNRSEVILKSFKNNVTMSYVVKKEIPATLTEQAIPEVVEHVEPTVLCAVNKISIGFDAPDIVMGVLTRKTAVRSLYYQQVGRMIRTHPGKEYAEILDLAGLTSDFGYHDEVYEPPDYGDKEGLAKANEELTAREISLLVGEDPTEMTREMVNVKVEELRRKRKQMHQLGFHELLNIFEASWEPKEIIEAAFNIKHRKTGEDFKKATVEWAAQPWYAFLTEYPQYHTRILKAMKTRCKNIVSQNKKLASIHYFPQWLSEQVPYSSYLQDTREELENQVRDMGMHIDINEDEIPF